MAELESRLKTQRLERDLPKYVREQESWLNLINETKRKVEQQPEKEHIDDVLSEQAVAPPREMDVDLLY